METSNMQGTFPPWNGISWPAGTYRFLITAHAGQKSASQEAKIILLDPCPDTELSIN